LQKNVLPSFTISKPEISMFLFANKSKYSCGKSFPTTETIAEFTLKCAADSPIYVAAPPKILSVLPKGVSIASKATVPTINNLLIKLFINEDAMIIRKHNLYKIKKFEKKYHFRYLNNTSLNLKSKDCLLSINFNL